MDCANLLALSVKLALLANLFGLVTPQQAAAGESGRRPAAVQGACGTKGDRLYFIGPVYSTAKPFLDCANLLALSVKPALLANL
ncbi:MAG: hypothetical protein JJT75_05700 [Opitutales bacterium]|nr:hypothetical protein [Opitutales bacterium]